MYYYQKHFAPIYVPLKYWNTFVANAFSTRDEEHELQIFCLFKTSFIVYINVIRISSIPKTINQIIVSRDESCRA